MKLFFAILLSFFVLSSCQTIENKTNKIGKKEVKEISKFIQQPESELKIVMGEPDEVKYDDKGSIARSGKFEELYLSLFLDKYFNNPLSKKKSFDTNDFDNFITMPSDISLQDGATNLTEITAEVISRKIKKESIYVCGGGRKNKYLIERIENKIGSKIKLIDKLGLNGDFIESQAFAYLAIRSYLKLPISFPNTTGVKKPCTGGIIIKN